MTTFITGACYKISLCAFSLGFILNTVQGTTVTPPEFTQLVKEADYVVRAVVKSVDVVEKANHGQRVMPYSLVEMEVKQVIVGTPPRPLILEVLGGKVGDREMFISGAPKFTVGEEAVFFVQGNHTQIFPLARMMHGLYPIRKEATTGREYVARSNGEPMANTSEVSQPMREVGVSVAQITAQAKQALTPDNFATQIRAAAKVLRANEK